MKRLFFISLLFFTALSWNACNPFKLVPEGESLLNKNKLKLINKSEKEDFKESLFSVIIPKPNHKTLGFYRFNLDVYDLFYKKGLESPDSAKGIRKFMLNTIGEPPVILDDSVVHTNVVKMKRFMRKEGYFNADVKDTITFRKNLFYPSHKVANVYYTVICNEPYRYDSINYSISDPVLDGIVRSDCSVNSVLKKGQIYDEDDLEKERERITYELKSRGYYYFNKEYIHYYADTSLNSHKVNILMELKRVNEGKNAQAAGLTAENHHVYYFKNIYIQTDYNPIDAQSDKKLDTVLYRDCYFLSYPGSPKYHYEILYQTIFLRKNDLYQIRNQEETYRRLADLGIFKFTTIKFDSVPMDSSATKYEQNVTIQLSPSRRQAISIETEGTNQGGSPGISLNIDYNNKNTFNGIEFLDIKGKINLEAQKTFLVTGAKTNNFFTIFNTLEYGPEITLNIPKWIIPPWSMIKHLSQYSNPKTTISTSYFNQIRPDYSRSLINFTLGQNYRAPGKDFEKTTFVLFIPEVNYVKVTLDSAFKAFLNSFNDQVLTNSYREHMTIDYKLSDQKNTQNIVNKLQKYSLHYYTLEGGLDNEINISAPYGKLDIDKRWYFPLSAVSTFAIRGFTTLGYPFGKLQTLPFEKSSYGGGANDNRAWIAHTLGPGAYQNITSIDQYGDIKILCSEELRFPMFWVLDGAFFLDEGNIWLSKKDPLRPNSQFSSDFYTQIGVGGGIGIRFNFNFFIIRFDEAWQVYDPSRASGYRLVADTREYSLRRMKVNIGIGYPF